MLMMEKKALSMMRYLAEAISIRLETRPAAEGGGAGSGGGAVCAHSPSGTIAISSSNSSLDLIGNAIRARPRYPRYPR